MKHKMRTVLCLVLILCLAFTSTAYAANESSAETRITYTKEGESSQPVLSTASYEINIPAEVSLNAGRELYITANSMSLPAGDSVVVSVDYARSFTTEREETAEGGVIEESYIKLDSSSGDNFAKVSINRAGFNDNAGSSLIYATDSVAAVFTGSSLQPTQYGVLYLNLYRPGTIQPGTYSGTLYFTIELVHG